MRWILVLSFIIPGLAQQAITLDGSGSGQVFRGISALSAGATTRLWIDYPEPQRSQLMQLLFQDNFAASLPFLKVEIGGDGNGGAGVEPSHERLFGVTNYNRGYEWELMKRFKAIQPTGRIYALAWSSAGWTGTSDFCTTNFANYVVDWIKGLKNSYGITLDMVGVGNEAAACPDLFNVTFKNILTGSGLTTQLASGDNTMGGAFNIATAVKNDSTAGVCKTVPPGNGICAAIDVLSGHYPTGFVAGADALYDRNTLSPPKEIIDSENGPWCSSWGCTGSQSQGKDIGQILLADYVNGAITSTDFWALITSYYPIASLSNAGLMTANTPWSGFYSIDPAMWAVAHHTQFIKVGWQYLDGAVTTLNSGGYAVAAKATNSCGTTCDYSVVVNTKGAGSTQTLNYTISNVKTSALHVWKSDGATQFIQQADITPSGGTFSLAALANSMYSLTTTTGQQKGTFTPPSASNFPVPYNDQFECGALGSLPRYFSDYSGAFELAAAGGGRSGKVARQVAKAAPVPWPTAATLTPYSYIGDANLTNYEVTADVMFESSVQNVILAGRLSTWNQNSGAHDGYELWFKSDGTVTIKTGAGATVGSPGSTTAPGLNNWVTLTLRMNGSTLTALVNGVSIISGTNSASASGLAGIGVDGYTQAQFDNFRIDPVGGSSGWTACPATPAGVSQSGAVMR